MNKLPGKTKSQLGSRGHSLNAHVEEVIRDRIRDGFYAPGALLPGRRALCEDLGIAPSTLDKAIKNLLVDGTLRAENRRGTFVGDTISPRDLSRDHVRSPKIRRLQEVNRYRIGVVDTISDLTSIQPDPSQFEYMIVHAAESLISEHGSQMLYGPKRAASAGTLAGAVDHFRETAADAVIFNAYHTAPDEVEDAIQRCRSYGIAPIVISSSNREWSCPHVWTDNRIAGRQAADFLLDAGHRSILYIAPYTYEWQEQRLLGVRDAMRGAGLGDGSLRLSARSQTDQVWLSANDQAAVAGSTLFKRAYESYGITKAVIAPNDWTAIGIADAIKDLGYEVGKDIALVSFDDSPVCRKNDLSSIRFPLEQLGREAAMLALRAAHGELTHHRLRISGSLILRGSTSDASPDGTGVGELSR